MTITYTAEKLGGDSGAAFLSWQAREGGDDEGGARTGLLRRRRPPPQPPSPSAPPPPSSSPPATEGGKSTSKIAKAIRDRISSFSSPRTRLSCWGNTVTRHPIRRSWSGTGTGGGEHGAGARTVTVTAVMAPSSKAIAAGARSLIERNDFYCQDCNTHK
nr:uncharacterized protein LOC127339656 [Lolium perenne]